MSRRALVVFVAVVGLLLAGLALWLRPGARDPAGGGASDASPAAGARGATQPAPGTPGAADAGADARAAPGGAVRVRAAWGAAPGALGRKGDPETAAEGPMSLVADGQGRIWVLDQANRRVQRFTAEGAVDRVVPIGGDTAQDLRVTRDGRLVLLDRLGEGNVQVLGAGGEPLGEVPLKGRGIGEGGGTTGVFLDGRGGVYVEREHRALFRIADESGRADPARPSVPGRPRRDGGAYLNAAILDRGAGLVTVSAKTADDRLLWETPVGLGAPVLHIALLDSDAAGNTYVAGEVGRESPTPPYRLVDVRLVIVGLAPNGTVRGTLSLDATPAAEESFRPLEVADDGTIYRLVRTPAGVVVEAYRL